MNEDLKSYSFLIADPELSDEDVTLANTLRKSQYLTLLESPLAKEMLAGSDKDALKSFKNFKAKPHSKQTSFISEIEL